MRTGQFGVVKTRGLMPWLIRLGTRSQVNHAFVFVSEDEIVEAEPRGARRARATEYHGSLISRFDLSASQAATIADNAYGMIGTPYGFLDIAVIALLALGIRWAWLENRAQSSRSLICSQLVDRVYANAGIALFDDGRPDGHVTPGDLLVLLAERSQSTAL